MRPRSVLVTRPAMVDHGSGPLRPQSRPPHGRYQAVATISRERPGTTLPPMEMHGEQPQSGLREYGRLLWVEKTTIIAITVLCVVASLAYSFLVTPTYQASASVLLEPEISQTLQQATLPSASTPTVNVPDSIEVIESSAVSDLVALKYPDSPGATATQVGTTDVVQVSVRSADRQQAAALANEYAHAYIAYEQKQTLNTFASAENLLQSHINTVELAISLLEKSIASTPTSPSVTGEETQLTGLQQQLASLQDQLENYQFYSSQGGDTEAGQIITPATIPANPASPKTVEWAVLALLFGLILGTGIVLLFNALSETESRRP